MRNSFSDYCVFRTMHTEKENNHLATTRRADLFWSGADLGDDDLQSEEQERHHGSRRVHFVHSPPRTA